MPKIKTPDPDPIVTHLPPYRVVKDGVEMLVYETSIDYGPRLGVTHTVMYDPCITPEKIAARTAAWTKATLENVKYGRVKWSN